MGIDFDRHRAACRIGFVFRVLIDFAPQLVRLLAVHAPRLTAPFSWDFAQPFKEQHTAGILCTDSGNAVRHLMGGVFIHAPHMSPDLLVAVFSLHWLPGLPLLFRDALQVLIAVLVKPLIRDKDGFDDPIILAHADHREILHVEVHRHGDQVRIFSAFLDLFRCNVFQLGEVQGRRLFLQDELGALQFPGRITPARFKVSTQPDRIGMPFPSGSGVHLEASEAGAWSWAQIDHIQLERECFVIERGIIASGRWARLPFFRARSVPVRQIRQVRARLANGIFDDRAAVDKGKIGKLFAKVVGGKRMGVIASGDRQGFSPGQQLVRTAKPFSFLLMLLREIPHTLGQLVWVSQKKSEVEGTGRIQDLDRLFQIRSFTGIGSSSSTIGEVKEQLRGAARLSHWLALPALSYFVKLF